MPVRTFGHRRVFCYAFDLINDAQTQPLKAQ